MFESSNAGKKTRRFLEELNTLWEDTLREDVRADGATLSSTGAVAAAAAAAPAPAAVVEAVATAPGGRDLCLSFSLGYDLQTISDDGQKGRARDALLSQWKNAVYDRLNMNNGLKNKGIKVKELQDAARFEITLTDATYNAEGEAKAQVIEILEKVFQTIERKCALPNDGKEEECTLRGLLRHHGIPRVEYLVETEQEISDTALKDRDKERARNYYENLVEVECHKVPWLLERLCVDGSEDFRKMLSEYGVKGPHARSSSTYLHYCGLRPSRPVVEILSVRAGSIHATVRTDRRFAQAVELFQKTLEDKVFVYNNGAEEQTKVSFSNFCEEPLLLVVATVSELALASAVSAERESGVVFGSGDEVGAGESFEDHAAGDEAGKEGSKEGGEEGGE